MSKTKKEKVFETLLYSAILFKEAIIPFDLTDKEFKELHWISKKDFIKELQEIVNDYDFDLNLTK